MPVLKPFVINQTDIQFILDQLNFIPLFDAAGNAIIQWDGAGAVYDQHHTKLWDTDGGSYTYKGTVLTATNYLDVLGTSYQTITDLAGLRDVTGLNNNLTLVNAEWGAVDQIFTRSAFADYAHYSTLVQSVANTVYAAAKLYYGTYSTDGSATDGTPVGYLNAALNANYAITLDTTPGAQPGDHAATDGTAINIQNVVDYTPRMISLATTTAGVTYDTWANHQFLSGGTTPNSAAAAHGVNEIYYGDDGKGVAIVLDWGQLETVANGGLGQVDTQARLAASAGQNDHFIGALNPGVSPSNGFFALFGQFFDHGLDFIDKSSGATVKITLAADDPLYGMKGPDGQPVHEITINRATVQSMTTTVDANGISHTDPQYVNHTSPYIDQSQTYGSHEQLTNLLREWVPDTTTENSNDYHAGMKLFDGQTLATQWTKADGTTTNETLPTLDELRAHVEATGRDALTWEDVNNLRNRDASGHVIADGQPGAGMSGSALLLDMNPRFDLAHLRGFYDKNGDQIQDPGEASYANTAQVQAIFGDPLDPINKPGAIAILNADVKATYGNGVDLHINANGVLELTGLQGPGSVLTGASALYPWVDFSNFGIMQTHANMVSAAISDAAHAAVGEILMASVGDHYIAGDGRVNENFGLTSIHHIFHEEHNYQVQNLIDAIHREAIVSGDLSKLHEFQIDTGHGVNAAGDYLAVDGTSIAWDQDKLFNGAKLIVEMEYQHAAVDQYARNVTPNIQEFVGYSADKNAAVSLEYAQAAFRFGHSTLRETIDTIDPDHGLTGKIMGYALKEAFLNPDKYADIGPSSILLGMTHQQMNEVDEFVTPALNQGLLDQPLDLAAINIARGRDIGLPTLNDFREAIGLTRYTSWTDFGQNMQHPTSLVNFIAAYSFDGDMAKANAIIGLVEGTVALGSPEAQGFTIEQAYAFLDGGDTGFEHIDTWLGGLAEIHQPGGLLGETFDKVFVTQIESLMDGDRFYYLFRLAGQQFAEEIGNGQLKDIVERNTGLTHLNGNIFGYADQYVDLGAKKEVVAPGAEALTTGNEHKYGDVIATFEAAHDLGATLPVGKTLGDNVVDIGTGGTHDYVETIGIYSNGGRGNLNDGKDVVIGGTHYLQDTRLANTDPNSAYGQNGFTNLDGTPNSGAESNEVIVGSKGNDLIYAQGGDDTVYGDAGNDKIYGGFGIDRLYGGDGSDKIYGGDNPDLIDGGSGDDFLYGESSGSDINGNDQVIGGSGNDFISGGTGIDKLSGGTGDDKIYGDQDTDPFTHGSDGNDYVDGGSGGDILYGDNGSDIVVGGADQDQLFGGNGDDILRPGDATGALTIGTDEVLGGDGVSDDGDKPGTLGFDVIDFSDNAVRAGGVKFDLGNQLNPGTTVNGTPAQIGTFQIEGLVGSAGNDTLIGSSAGDAGNTVHPELDVGENWIVGGSGDDKLTGGGGNDLIIGGSIRLDTVIGAYSSGYTHNNNNTGATQADQLEDARYQGASHRVAWDETIGSISLIDAVNATIANPADKFEKHFTEMLRTEMFKDTVLGDNKADGTNDIAYFTGNKADYDVSQINFVDSRGTAMTAFKVVGARGAGVADGTDIVVGVESLQFADTTMFLVNKLPTGLPTITGDQNVLTADIAAIADLNGLPAPAGFQYQWQSSTDGLNGWGPVAGANAQSYTVTDSKFYRVVVSYTDGLGFFETLTSQITAKVGTNNAETITGTVDPNLLNGRNGNDNLIGGDGNDVLNGGSGDDLLNGGIGADTMRGGDGKDTYYIDNTGDLVIETNASTNANESDIVRTMINYTLTPNVERLLVEATGTATLVTGNALNNQLDGRPSTVAALTLDGGAGNDIIYGSNLGHSTLIAGGANPGGVDELHAYGVGNTLIGGDGNTYYYSESATDFIQETNANAVTGGASDLLTATYSVLNLATNVENLTLGGTAYYGVGNSLNNVIRGNASANVIDGGLGRDTMIGGDGDDTYYVDNVSDVITEASNAGSGTDIVHASINYTLGVNVERLYVEGNATSGIGNTLDNVIDGRGSTKVLTLDGGAGNDIMFGSSAGSNTMNGGTGTGADEFFAQGDFNRMTGGDGNDRYHSSSANDIIVEAPGAGSDTQFVTYSGIAQLADNVEQLILQGASTGGTGNALLNTINAAGLAQAATITGGLGTDFITGSSNDDTIIWNANASGATDGRDTINGGANTATGDRFVVNGNGQTETYTIYSNKDDWDNNAGNGIQSSARHFIAGYNGTADIVITRAVPGGAASIIAELTSIEEITINTADTSVAGGIQAGGTTSAAGDTISVVGDFVPTGLNFNTITVNGGAGTDTVDITGLTSAHRIVLNTNGGSDTIIGDLRAQDLIDSVSNAAVGSVTSVEPVRLLDASVLPTEPASVASVDPVKLPFGESDVEGAGSIICVMPARSADAQPHIDTASDSFVFSQGSSSISSPSSFQPGDAIDLKPLFATLQLSDHDSASTSAVFNAAGNLKVDDHVSDSNAAPASQTNDNHLPFYDLHKTASGSDFV